MSDILEEIEALIPGVSSVKFSEMGSKIKDLKIGDFLTAESEKLVDFCSEKFTSVVNKLKVLKDPSLDDVRDDINLLKDMGEKLSKTLEEAGNIETVQDAVEMGLVKEGETADAKTLLNRLFDKLNGGE